ncbi:MAG: LamG domain-containing protein, partial [Planctomycetota bacterium]
MMCRKLTLMVSLVVVLGLAGSVFATLWTNDGGDNSWCNDLNWDLGTPWVVGDDGVAVIDPCSGNPNASSDEVIVKTDCNAATGMVEWTVDVNQTFTIEADANLFAGNPDGWGGFLFNEGEADATATINIYGYLKVYDTLRAPDSGSGIMNIYPGAKVQVDGWFRGCDNPTGWYEVNMYGGDVNVGEFKLGDEGSGAFYMSGGKFSTRNRFEITGRQEQGDITSELEIVIDGGAELYVGGNYIAPSQSDANASINIINGEISVGSWSAAGDYWIVDINDNGVLRIRGGGGTNRLMVEEWIEDEQIIGRGGDVIPTITEDGNDLVLAIDFVHKTAWNPLPRDDGGNVCPGDSLSWEPGVHVVTHTIYFGTSLDDVNGSATPVVTLHPTTSWSPPGLVLNEHYYWRIDEVNDLNPETPWTGGIWEFDTSDGNAFAVSPEYDEDDVPRSTDLTWASCGGTLYDVYFSTDINDVRYRDVSARIAENTSDTTVDPTTVDPNLEWRTVYYWAVDIVGGSGDDGDLWHFETESQIIDPNMTVWYKLDETSGDDALDSSGYGNDGDVDDEVWDPLDGQFGGSLNFGSGENDTSIEVDRDATAALGSSVSISVWLKNAIKDDEDNWVFGIGTDEGDYEVRAAVPMADGRTVEWRAGNDSNDVLRWDMSLNDINPRRLSDWHHWAFVKDETAGNMKIYFDGELVDSNDGVSTNLSNLRRRWFSIGGASGDDGELQGKVDDFRFFIKALTPEEVESLFRGGDLAVAWAPVPRSGAGDADPNVVLRWKAGDFATHHEVYIGNTYAEVADANTSTVGIYIDRFADVPDNNYPLPDPLPLNSIRYWRIDEVNDVNNPDHVWKGNVWEFTIANYLVIDDFESYTYPPDILWHTWENPDWTGSFPELGRDPYDPVHFGTQSMKYTYNNDYYGVYYSEIERNYDSAQNWEYGGVKMLTIFFYGLPGNDANEQMYVGLEDSNGLPSYSEIRYGDYSEDMNDIREAEWHEWNIALSDFTGVTLTDVRTVYIGFGDSDAVSAGGAGIVYMDNIRLYPPKCVPRFGPVSDLSGNCIVDLADVRIIGSEWLKHDMLLDVNVPPTAPVGHWKFEGNADDSSVNNYHGTAEGDYSYVSGKIDSWAIEFAGGKVLVSDDGSTPLLNPASEVSVTAWVNFSDNPDGYSARVIVKGVDANDSESYGLEINDDGEPHFLLRDSNHGNHGLDSGETIPHDEWIHLAGVYDGNDIKVYINGALIASNDSEPGMLLLQDTNDLAIGGAVDVNRPFLGTVDDARVYGYGLTDAEVAYIGT